MRCIICNNLLTDEESVKKYPVTHPLFNNYIDTCNECLDVIRDTQEEMLKDKDKKEGLLNPSKFSKYY